MRYAVMRRTREVVDLEIGTETFSASKPYDLYAPETEHHGFIKKNISHEYSPG
jgi:hypothetical protein